MADGAASSKDEYRLEETDGGKQRFSIELEFVQALSNPAYIHHLAQNRFLDDPAFIHYLNYLQYWKQPPYLQFIRFPHCLFFLDLLQSASFREAIAHHESKELAHRQQYFFWLHYRNNRLKQLQAQQELHQGARQSTEEEPAQKQQETDRDGSLKAVAGGAGGTGETGETGASGGTGGTGEGRAADPASRKRHRDDS